MLPIVVLISIVREVVSICSFIDSNILGTLTTLKYAAVGQPLSHMYDKMK